MRVWHFNGVITTYGKRDCRNSWRYTSLAVNRGAIKRGFTVHILLSPNTQINHLLTYLDVSSLFISLKSAGITFVASDPEPYGFGS